VVAADSNRRVFSQERFMFSLASGAISREYLAGGFGKMSPTRAGKLTPNCVFPVLPHVILLPDAS
jgi:hypothetical protein